MNKLFIPKFTKERINEVFNKLTPQKSRACNNNIIFGPSNNSYSGNYYGYSLKRSCLKQCTFDNATFDHTSLAGSTLEDIQFSADCKIESLYLNKSTLSNITFGKKLYINNSNFSDSYLKNVRFLSNELRSTFFENSHLQECLFQDCTIRSTMFGGAYLYKCIFENCNMRNLNVEFSYMEKCTLNGSCISFFQLPYIIGIFKDLSALKKVYLGKNKQEPLPFDTYFEEIDDSIIYFTSLEEYFPLANLYYAIGKLDYCYSSIMLGIEKSLANNEIRMIENFCKLGQCYEILNIGDIHNILKRVDDRINSISGNNIFSILLKQSYELKGSVLQNISKDKLEIIINTSLQEKDFDKVSEFCKDIDTIITSIMPKKVTTSYQLSHNSPFEVCLTCIGFITDLLTISNFIYIYISNRTKNTESIPTTIKEYIEKSNESYINSLNYQFDCFSDLMNLTAKNNQSKIIEDFRAKIISSASDQINKDYSLIISKSHK